MVSEHKINTLLNGIAGMSISLSEGLKLLTEYDALPTDVKDDLNELLIDAQVLQKNADELVQLLTGEDN